MSETILPCPFCGQTPVYGDADHYQADEDGWGVLECLCGARSPQVPTRGKFINDWRPSAIASWNQRTMPDVALSESTRHRERAERLEKELRNPNINAELMPDGRWMVMSFNGDQEIQHGAVSDATSTLVLRMVRSILKSLAPTEHQAEQEKTGIGGMTNDGV